MSFPREYTLWKAHGNRIATHCCYYRAFTLLLSIGFMGLSRTPQSLAGLCKCIHIEVRSKEKVDEV